MEHLLAMTLAWALAFTPYSDPPHFPEAQFVSNQWIREQFCPKPIHATCEPKALYGNGVVYLNEEVGTTFDDWKSDIHAIAMVSHEMAHYLQDINGQNGTTCEDIIEREREGYYVQEQVLKRFQRFKISVAKPLLTCKSDSSP